LLAFADFMNCEISYAILYLVSCL